MIRSLIPHAIMAMMILPAPVLACDFCEKKVTMTRPLAKCYLGLYEREVARIQSARLPAQLVNLSVCDGVDLGTRGTNKLPTSVEAQVKLSTTFLLDEEGLICLARALENASWPAEEGKALTIEVPRGCQAQ